MSDARAARQPLTFECCIPGCRRVTHSEFHDICTIHFIRIGHQFLAEAKARAGIDLDPDREYEDPRESVVYYVRMGDHVKIGYSIHLPSRLSALYLDASAVLATEPGGRDLEQKRHAQFAAERVTRRRELFNPSRRLLEHIERIAAR